MKAIFFVALFSTLCTYSAQQQQDDLSKVQAALRKEALELHALAEKGNLDKEGFNRWEAIQQRLRDIQKALAFNYRGSM